MVTRIGYDVLVLQATGQLAIVNVLEGRLAEAYARLRRKTDRSQGAPQPEGLATALDTVSALAVVLRRSKGGGPTVAVATLREEPPGAAALDAPVPRGLRRGSHPHLGPG